MYLNKVYNYNLKVEPLVFKEMNNSLQNTWMTLIVWANVKRNKIRELHKIRQEEEEEF